LEQYPPLSRVLLFDSKGHVKPLICSLGPLSVFAALGIPSFVSSFWEKNNIKMILVASPDQFCGDFSESETETKSRMKR
jgi:hypothetical protein